MRKFFLLSLSLLFLIQLSSFGQALSGKVIGETGVAASKVNVSFLNSANKVETKADGSFKIIASKLPDTLVFSSPGFEPYKVVITEKNIKDPNFEVVLLNKRSDFAKTTYSSYAASPVSSELKEVVVTSAFGTKRKSRSKSVAAGRTSADKYERDGTYDYAYSSPKSSTGTYYSYVGASYNGFYAGKMMNMLDSISPSKDSAKLKTQILTAGEINDFNKWKMWEDLSATEFKQWSTYWGVSAKKRFSVQLQNKNYSAIINQPVYLIDKKTNARVWSGITDNTGKAELWANFNGKGDSLKEYIIKDADGNTVAAPVTFEHGINHLMTDKSCGAGNAVDIAFVIDATGSMGDEIEFLKFEMEDVIRKTYATYNTLDLKVGSVFYRDKGDEYVTKSLDFQNDLLKVLNFVKLQRDGGGGDEPEALDSALDVALNKLSWRKEARTRIMFLFLDAPPHDYAIPDMYKMIEKAAAMGIRIVPVACSGSGKSNEYLLRSMALATNGTYAFLTDHSRAGGKHTEASTDSYDVELLNNLLQRIIQQFVFVKDCASNTTKPEEPFFHQPENVVKIKIYPNPTQGNVTIESDKELKEVYICDFTGKLLMKLSSSNRGKWQVNIGNYPSGTYLVKYITADNKWGTEKVVLIH